MGRIVIVFILSALMAGCYIDMPHDARFDPDNPLGVGIVSLSVKDKAGTPVRDALIVINGTDTLLTDSRGLTDEIDIVSDSLSMHIHKQGYSDYIIDTVIVTGDSVTFNAVLNYIPVLGTCTVTSAVIKKDGILDTVDYFVTYTAELRDADGTDDISTVYVMIDSVRYEMDYKYDNDTMMVYSCVFDENSAVNVFDLVGLPAAIGAEDSDNAGAECSDLALVRFVDNIAEILKPKDGLIFSMPDTIIWNADEETYHAELGMEIMSGNTAVFSLDGLDVNLGEHYLDTVFSSGGYTLYIRIGDRYGNYSQNSVFFTVP